MFCKISAGMASTRLVVTIQSPNAEKQRSLPKHDWQMKMVNVTPGMTHRFSYKLRNIEGNEKLKIKDDNAIVLNRLKFWIGIGATVWAFEFMKILSHFFLLLNKMII